MGIANLAEHLEAEACPHLAVFLRSADELPELLVSFYSLGVRRGGWLVHRALPAHAEHERHVLTDGGLDVAALEASHQMVIVELDFDVPAEGSTTAGPEHSTKRSHADPPASGTHASPSIPATATMKPY